MLKKMLFLTTILFFSSSAFAADRATVLFESGQIVVVDDGYLKIVEEYKRLNRNSSEHHIIELSVGGGTFLMNLAQVVVVCRDDCRSLFYTHQLDPGRGKK